MQVNDCFQLQRDLGIQHYQSGQLSEAEDCFQNMLRSQPDDPNLWHSLGVISFQLGHYSTAIERLNCAIALNPKRHNSYDTLGSIYLKQKKWNEAIACFQTLAQLQSNRASAHVKLGNAYHLQGKTEKAIASYQSALKLQPDSAKIYAKLGLFYRERGNFEEAIAAHKHALELQPDSYPIHTNLGNIYQEIGKSEEAVTSCKRVLQLKPDFYPAHANLGTVLKHQGKLDEAIAHYQQALKLQPDFPPAHYNLGSAYQELGKLVDAIASYQRALKLQPDYPEVLKEYVWVKRGICNWDELLSLEQSLVASVRAGQWSASPLPLLATSDDLSVQLAAARKFCISSIGIPRSPHWTGPLYRHGKIRLAYLSADFREHPVARVMVELFERHDRSRFEVTAISFGPDETSSFRQRLVRAFDRFIDIRQLSYREAARLLRELEIDIAIDLTGHTRYSRTQVLAHRPAPIQVNYIGYPATMGADFIDYILVDPFIVPAEQQPYFSENLVHLPDCYLGRDNTQAIAERVPSRSECGLPKGGFVFSSFNNSYKITPTVFNIWMRLLNDIPGSVLWLKHDGLTAAENLRVEAVKRGIDPDRLVFAPRLDKLSEHLARHHLANLFLDCFPYNAHSTASDALWAGLPLLTCAGRSFASRVAGSLLYALGLPELVTHSLEAYEAQALKLATQPDVLGEIREKLAQNRLSQPLFNSDRLRLYIEAAYTQMWSFWQQGEQPRTFAVPKSSVSEYVSPIS
ncbi:MAG: tetratricopeptide repeat protein [Cyanobacteria bacterium P01_F01_bin.33]